MIKILVADDHAIVRNSIKQIISDESDMEVTCEAEDTVQLFQKLENYNVDLIVMDFYMRGMNALEVMPVLCAKYAHIPVLVISALSEELYSPKLLKAGASGFINKECAADELVQAILNVMSKKSSQ
jgi:DNA-binding NarL/FixJ family response regulator